MNTTRRSHKLLAMTAASALVFAACGSDDDSSTTTDGEASTGTDAEAPAETDGEAPAETDGEAPAETDGEEAPAPAAGDGGTLIWAHEQEPGDLHLDDPENNLSITSWIRSAMIEGLFGISGATEYYPELLADDGELTTNDDGTVTGTFTMRDGLSWSDGTALTADDVLFTFNSIMATDGETEDGDPNYIYLFGDRTGWDTITEISADGNTLSITWESFFAGYKGVLNEIYPAHQFSDDPATAAAELNDGLREWTAPDGATIASAGRSTYFQYSKALSSGKFFE